MAEDFPIQASTPLGFSVRISRSRWEIIATIKHPVMAGLLGAVCSTIENPDEIRRSKSASNVLLFYRNERPGRWVCVVVRRPNGDGFLITSYLTDAIKEGEHLWNK